MSLKNYTTKVIKKGFTDFDGKKINLSSNIDEEESIFLYNFIRERNNIKNVLEIGCANGISSLTIASALADRGDSFLTIIDPNQKNQWNDIGVKLLKKAFNE